ncbi:MAG: inositol monophosphatase [Candidatus Sumerlaeia bacterium]|nr:inositol monophosphatase [Candidatus Sumerlaeia bacterium]
MNRPPEICYLRALQEILQRTVMESLRARSTVALAQVAKDAGGDIIYAMDADVEKELVTFCRMWSAHQRFILIAEGVGETGRAAFPPDTTPDNAEFYLIVDPIDGTRPLMYDKRSAWSLAAIVPNSDARGRRQEGKGGAGHNNGPKSCPTLRDATMACMTELPTSKQIYADCLFTVRGERPRLVRRRLDTGAEVEHPYSPSRADSIEHGFAMLTNFFPGGKEMVAAIEEELVRELGGLRSERAIVFADQYLSTAGQWYELIVGHDRFNGDLRGRMIERGIPAGAVPALAAHPYDCCVELLAREAGVIVTDLEGNPFDAPLDTESPVSWLAYANEALRQKIEPVMQRLLRKHGLIS